MRQCLEGEGGGRMRRKVGEVGQTLQSPTPTSSKGQKVGQSSSSERFFRLRRSGSATPPPGAPNPRERKTKAMEETKEGRTQGRKGDICVREKGRRGRKLSEGREERRDNYIDKQTTQSLRPKLGGLSYT